MTLTIVDEARPVTGGVDTHADTHMAAALDRVGGLLGVQEFPATPAGYARLLAWLGGFGTVLQRREDSEPRLRAARDPSSTEPPLRTPAPAPPQPLVVAAVLLGIALCTFASDALLRYSATWPWWAAVAATFLAFAAASSGVRADATRAAILAVNTLWFFTYSVIIVEYRQSSSPGSIGHLAALSWIGAAANALFLVMALARSFWRRQASTSPLELQPFLLCCLAVGMGVTAIALRGSSNGLWDLAGWIFIAAFLAELVLLLPARTLTGRTPGVQS